MMRKSRSFSIFIMIAIAFLGIPINTAFGDAGVDRIELRYPAVVENYGHVAVGITLNAPLQPGQTLSIYSNGKLANSIKTNGFGVKQYNSAVRLAGNGTIEVRILDPQGQVLASRSGKPKVILPLPASPIPASRRPLPESFVKAKKPSVRKRGHGEFSGDFSVRFSMKHALKPGQIGYIDLKSSGGSIAMSITAYSAPVRYLGLILDRNPGSFDVSARLE